MWTLLRWSHAFSALILTAWVCVLLGSAIAVPSSQQQNRQQQRQNATTPNKPSKGSPSTSSKSQQHPSDQERNHDSALQWATFIAACLAAVATATYAYFSYRQWKATEVAANAARDSAEAAKRSADILVDSERPHIIAEKVTIESWTTDYKDRRIYLRVGFRGYNYGRNPGWPSKLQIRVVVDASENLQEHGGPKYVDQTDPLGGVIAPRAAYHRHGMTFAYTDPFLLSIDQNEFSDVMERKRNLFLYGFMEYGDYGGHPHRTHFGFRYAPGGFPEGTPAGVVFIMDRAYWQYT